MPNKNGKTQENVYKSIKYPAIQESWVTELNGVKR